MKNSKQLEHNQLIEAFKTLFLDQYFHDSCNIKMLPGIDDGMLGLEIGTAMGHDGKSLELFFTDAAVFPKHQNTQGGEGGATAVIEGRGAYLIGCAMIGFALAADEKDELL